MSMKRFWFIITAFCIILTSVFSASAQTVSLTGANVSVNLPGAFTAVTNAPADINSHSDFIGTLGHSVSSFAAFLDEADILIFAATADNQRQVQIKSYTTEFSSEIKELSALDGDEESLNTAAERLVTVGGNETLKGISRVKTGDGRLYIKIEKLINASADYSCMQYVTVTGGKYYSMVYYNFGGAFTDEQYSEISSIFESLSIPGASSRDNGEGTGILIIVVGVLMAAAVVFTVCAAVSLIVELFRRRSSTDTDDVKIERRRFKDR